METIITVSKQNIPATNSGLMAVNQMLKRGASVKAWQDHGDFILFNLSTSQAGVTAEDLVGGIEYIKYDEKSLTKNDLGEL